MGRGLNLTFMRQQMAGTVHEVKLTEYMSKKNRECMKHIGKQHMYRSVGPYWNLQQISEETPSPRKLAYMQPFIRCRVFTE